MNNVGSNLRDGQTVILSASGMEKRFGGVHALRGASLELRRGEVHGLIGENGSGKSTLINILSGQLKADSGQIVLDDESVTFRNPTAALEHGIVTVTQETTLVPDLTIAENIFLGHRLSRRWFPMIDWSTSNARAASVLDRLGLELSPKTKVYRLRPDEQQMVEIARALSIDTRVLILDEPTSSLTDDEVDILFRIVRRLAAEGVACVFVSHRLPEVFVLTDRVTVLRDGRTVASSTTTDVTPSTLIRQMIGREAYEMAQGNSEQHEGDVTLRVRNLSLPGRLNGVSFGVGPGEIVGLAGLVGAGRSEVLESIFGLHHGATGEIEFGGEHVRFRSPRQAVRKGMVFVPSDRKRLGLVLRRSLLENVTMTVSALVWRLRRPQRGVESVLVRDAIRNFGIVAASPRVQVSTLSGGNQQKVVLARALALNPTMMMLDEPTRGVDVGAKSEIYRLLRTAAESGIGILVSSSETPELLILCDRIIVMFRGEVAARLKREEASDAVVTHYATGHT